MSTSELSWPLLLNTVVAGEDLAHEQARWAMDEIMSGNRSGVEIAGLLMALSVKGESVAEVAGLADMMVEHAVPLHVPSHAIDIVGTGGDQAFTVNISTMSSIVIAATGRTVIKHGNRASSSKSGSADCIEALGVRLDLPVGTVEAMAEEVGITFAFANVFHPAMRFAAEARRGLRVPTVFNYLGPITNPGRPRASAVGVANARMAPVLAGVFAERGTSALVFRGQDGLDELTVTAPSDVWEVRQGRVDRFVLDPFRQFGIDRATVADLRGGSAEHNARVAREIFGGRPGPIREAVLLNAAAGIVVADGIGRAPAPDDFFDRLAAARDLAARTIDEGAAAAKVAEWVAATGS